MKRVYIASPLRGNIAANIERAKEYCRKAARHGVLPIAPHIYFTQFLDDDKPQERDAGIRMGLELLKLCDAVYVYGNTISEGMEQEILLAESLGKEVLYF